MSSNIRELSPVLKKWAKENINEDSKQVPEILKQFRDWINKSPHLKVKDDDQVLLAILRKSEFSLEKAKVLLDNYCSARTHIPELLQDRDPLNPKLKKFLETGFFMFPLPKPASETSPRVLLYNVPKHNPEDYPILESLKVFFMTPDLYIREDDQLAVAGAIVLIDLKHLSFASVVKLNPSLAKKIVYLYTDASIFDIKEVYIINSPGFFEKIFNTLILPFLDDNMKKGVHVYGENYENLYKSVPREILPEEYGGSGGKLNEIIADCRENIYANRQVIIEASTQYGVNESKRVGKSNIQETIFGAEGSFRKLEID